MSRKEKLARRLKSRPSDLTFEELSTFLAYCGYVLENGSRTGGSRVAFKSDSGDYIRLHKPHPRNILKLYQVDEIIATLMEKGFL